MHQQRFDEITRTVASHGTRRGFVGAVVATVAAALGAGQAVAAPPAGKGTKPEKSDGRGKPQGRCQAGFTNCRGICVDLLGDRDNCGACATSCPDATVCAGGTCGCPEPGETYAGGICTTLATLSLTFEYSDGEPSAEMSVSGAGLDPGSEVTLELTTDTGNTGGNGLGTVDENGECSYFLDISCGNSSAEVLGTAADGTPISDSADVPC